MFINLFKNPFFSGVLGGLICFLFLYLDSKITNIKKEKKDYIKIFIITSLIISVMIYIVNINDILVCKVQNNNIKSSLKPILKSFENNDLPDF